MTLICNGYRNGFSPQRFFIGSQTTYLNGMAYRSQCLTGAMRNITAGEGVTDRTTSIPLGCRNPHAWMLGQVAGTLVSRNIITGTGVLVADGDRGKNADADLSGSGDLDATGSLVVALIAALVGSGAITDADLQAFLAAVADLTGSGDITSADLEALGALLADIDGDGTIASTLTGLGAMSSDIVSFGTLSPENLAASVWSSIAANYNVAGTMGEKLNDAGGAGNPWASLLDDNNDPGTFGERVQKLLTVVKFLGLK